MKVAYVCEPQLGGTFTFFLQIRPALAALGIDFRCVPAVAGMDIGRTRFAGTDGVDALAEIPENPAKALAALNAHLQKGGYDVVMTLPCGGLLGALLPMYLPPEFAVVVRVPMMTRGAYVPAREVAPWAGHFVAVSDRVANDLRDSYGIAADRLRVIYNGVPLASAPERRNGGDAGRPLRLIYTGRLSEMEKGIFLFPPLMANLKKAGISARLTIVGNGPDHDELKSRFQREHVLENTDFTGGLPQKKVAELLLQHDIYLLTSRFEGCPNSLIEAMAAGCACVASNIRDSVSRIVDDGRDGLLFRVGDVQELTDAVAKLARDPALRNRLGLAAREKVEQRFDIRHTAELYAAVLREAAASQSKRAAPLSLSTFSVPKSFRAHWASWLPPPVKAWLRTLFERRGRSI